MTITEYLREHLTNIPDSASIDFVRFQADTAYDCDTCGGTEMSCDIIYSYTNEYGKQDEGWYYMTGSEVVDFLNQITP